MKLLSDKERHMLYEVLDHYEFQADRRGLDGVFRWIRPIDKLLDVVEMEKDLENTGWTKTQTESTRVFPEMEMSTHLSNLGWEPHDSDRICFSNKGECLYISRTQTMWLAYV